MSALYGVGSLIHGRVFVTLPVPTADKDLHQQTIIVTGANTGLGYEASLHLAHLGVGRLIMAVRTQFKGEEARRRILKAVKCPESSIEVWTIDMDNHISVKAFATRASQLQRLDGVLANAGIMTTKFDVSEGNERTLNVNVINTILLYLLLLPKMRDSGHKTNHACRFVIPNSGLHYMAPTAELDPTSQNIIDRLNDPKRADMVGRYPLTKLLIVFAVRELADRSATQGITGCVINTPNPSFCKSNLAAESQDSQGYRIFERLMARSTEEGSRALVNGLLASPETNGQYLNNCHIARYVSLISAQKLFCLLSRSPANSVTSKKGCLIQKKFVNELLERLETVEPGITKNI